MPAAGKAESYRDKAGAWRVRLVAVDGSVVARRGPFETREEAKQAAVATVREHLAETRRPARRTLTEAQRGAIVRDLMAHPQMAPVIRDYRARLAQQAREQAATVHANRVVAERTRLAAVKPASPDGRRALEQARWSNESRDPSSGPGKLMSRVHEVRGGDSGPVQRLAEVKVAKEIAQRESASLSEAQRTERRMNSWRPGGTMYEMCPWFR